MDGRDTNCSLGLIVRWGRSDKEQIEDRILCSSVGCGGQAVIPAGLLSRVLGTGSLGSDFMGSTGIKLGL